jgi:hypothetical protein
LFIPFGLNRDRGILLPLEAAGQGGCRQTVFLMARSQQFRCILHHVRSKRQDMHMTPPSTDFLPILILEIPCYSFCSHFRQTKEAYPGFSPCGTPHISTIRIISFGDSTCKRRSSFSPGKWSIRLRRILPAREWFHRKQHSILPPGCGKKK